MNWPPEVPKMPPIFGDLFKRIIVRINEGWPVDGNGIRVVDAVGGRSVNLFGAPGGGVAGAPAVNCPFGASIVTAEDNTFVEIKWGTINGFQPVSMRAGGLPPFRVEIVEGQSIYFYATSHASLAALQWIDADIEVSNQPNLKSNRSLGRVLFASAGWPTSGQPSAVGECGNISMDICSLPV